MVRARLEARERQPGGAPPFRERRSVGLPHLAEQMKAVGVVGRDVARVLVPAEAIPERGHLREVAPVLVCGVDEEQVRVVDRDDPCGEPGPVAGDVDEGVPARAEVADPETAVSIGLGAAKLSSTASDTLWLFKPNPGRLETVAAWVGDDDNEIDRASAFGRAVVLAGFPAVALAEALVTAFVPEAWAAKYVLLVGAIFALEVVFTLVVRRTLAAIVRSRAAKLDARAALDVVLDEVRKGNAAAPQLVPFVLKSAGGRLRRFLNARDGGESQGVS